MKKVIALLLLLATMLAITSCEKPSEEDIMLSALLSYAVPGVFFEEQAAADYAVLDKDVWGRALVKYTYKSLLNGEDTVSYVIYQRYDETHLYFYDGLCYLIGEADANAIETLKAQNDWTLPPDDSKLARREVKTSGDGMRILPQTENRYKNVHDFVCEKLSVTEDDDLTIYFDDEDQAGLDLYFVKLDPFRPKKTVYYYFFICNEEGEFAYYKVENEADYAAALEAFKAQNDWTYTFES